MCKLLGSSDCRYVCYLGRDCISLKIKCRRTVPSDAFFSDTSLCPCFSWRQGLSVRFRLVLNSRCDPGWPSALGSQPPSAGITDATTTSGCHSDLPRHPGCHPVSVAPFTVGKGGWHWPRPTSQSPAVDTHTVPALGLSRRTVLSPCAVCHAETGSTPLGLTAVRRRIEFQSPERWRSWPASRAAAGRRVWEAAPEWRTQTRGGGQRQVVVLG